MFHRIHFLTSLALITLASTLASPSANAASITYTASGTGSDGALAASASFVTSAGQIQITLTNTLSPSSIVAPGQALSDLSFTLSAAAGTLGGSTASGQQGTIGTGGVVTYTSGTPGRFIGQGGGTFTVSGSNITLEAIGGSQPSEMILPTVANGGSYPNANNGIINNFDPYTIGPATFTLTLSGVTANTTVTSASFSFGTGPDTFVPGTPGTTPPVPEPSSLVLLGSGVAGLATMMRRRLMVAAIQ